MADMMAGLTTDPMKDPTADPTADLAADHKPLMNQGRLNAKAGHPERRAGLQTRPPFFLAK
jgi:hypothetical protein